MVAIVCAGALGSSCADEPRAFVEPGVAFRTEAVVVAPAKLVASDAAADDQFGASVALEKDTLVVGAPGADAGAAPNDAGAVYVFSRVGGAWVERQKLGPKNGPRFQAHFGASVALRGDTLLVGEPTTSGNGAAHLFTRTSEGWVEQQEFSGAGNFGERVALGDGFAVVAGPGINDGKVSLFRQSGATWVHTQTFNGKNHERLGASLAVNGGLLALGAPDAGFEPQAGRGLIYLFTSDAAGVFQPLRELSLTPSNGQRYGGFGSSIAMRGGALVVGMPGRDVPPLADAGSVETFDVGTFSLKERLFASDRSANAWFGTSIAIDESANAILVGSHGRGAYLFNRSGGVWVEEQRLLSAESGDEAGSAVALNGMTAAVGAPLADHGAKANAGAVYISGVAAKGQACVAYWECASQACVRGLCADGACEGAE